MIRTDSQGHPLTPPDPPELGAPIDDVIAWLRASAAHNDRVSTLANAAFTKQFHKTLKKGNR